MDLPELRQSRTMKIRLAADIQRDSIVDGEGIRAVIWTQGCPHHCKGCHNPETWREKGGMEVDLEDVFLALDELEGQDGITLSGGDPIFQVEASTQIAKYAKSIGLNVWCYTGYLYEEILMDPKKREILQYIDVLVDGKFVLEQRSLDLYFKGSKNQRVIDVVKSLEEGRVCLVEKYKDPKDISPRPSRSACMYI